MSSNRRFDWALAKDRLQGLRGDQYWRSLEELASTEEFQEYLYREFPENAAEWSDHVSRRNFLKLMGASLALAGLTACTRQPEERIIPYVRQPEEIIPGKPLFFASSFCLSGYAAGVLVESQMGRPTKIEGNPDHPASLGGTDVFTQASVLGLYDPDRSQAITYNGDISSWSKFSETVRILTGGQSGSSLRFLTDAISSPTIVDQFAQILQKFPGSKWYQFEPNSRDNLYEGARLALGQPVDTIYRFENAEVVVSIDSDFLSCGPGHSRYVRDFTARRKVRSAQRTMNRLYSIETTPSNTGAKADHRIPIRTAEIMPLVSNLVSALGIPGAANGQSNREGSFIAAIVRDLQAHRGASIVIAGDHQPPEIHAMVHAINSNLGNIGKTIFYIEPVVSNAANSLQSLRTLTEEMATGKVQTLLILGGNPVFTAPADFNFAAALLKVPLRIHLGLYESETSNLCHWHIPETHYLEEWGDARAYDGTASIVQPLIAPLYEGSKSKIEILATFTGNPEPSAYKIVREFWQKQNTSSDFEIFWRKSVHDGLIANTAYQPKSMNASVQAAQSQTDQQNNKEAVEILFRIDPTIYDGQFANNGWLQELPKPLTKVTWENVVYVSPATAQKWDTDNGDIVEIEAAGKKIRGPVWMLAGQPDDCITLHVGYGRWKSGKVGNGIGMNAYAIRSSANLWNAQATRVTKTGDHEDVACTQNHHVMEGRNVVRSGSLIEFLANPNFVHQDEEGPGESIYPDYQYKGYAWGMAIDQTACVGCNACVVACQSENNIPIVGKIEVLRGREMHWLRIDRYYQGTFNNPVTHFQPMLCQHCEHAPCELVCPVTATTHSSEGLNEMVYNRCVGTRYCSNNCPYKVRRFNFFLYSDMKSPTIKLLRNPDVTVRTRGVMEKCTYCVQRINYARIESEKQNRNIQDGDVVTACQQACPAEAITFGDINDPNSKVAKLKKEPTNYGVLEELNTTPRTTYLADLRNLNSEIKE
jgi:molybdopterin-containing oxidoreductase family iron-sulfur binding subunit